MNRTSINPDTGVETTRFEDLAGKFTGEVKHFPETLSFSEAFTAVNVHLGPEGPKADTHVYVDKGEAVAISVGHATLWMTPDQAESIRSQLRHRHLGSSADVKR